MLAQSESERGLQGRGQLQAEHDGEDEVGPVGGGLPAGGPGSSEELHQSRRAEKREHPCKGPKLLRWARTEGVRSGAGNHHNHMFNSSNRIDSSQDGKPRSSSRPVRHLSAHSSFSVVISSLTA